MALQDKGMRGRGSETEGDLARLKGLGSGRADSLELLAAPHSIF